MRGCPRGPGLALGILWVFGAAPALAADSATVQAGEDCEALVQRVYGAQPSSAAAAAGLARFHAANPQLGALPHRLRAGMVVSTPPLSRARRKLRAELPRLTYVGPAVRTRKRGSWNYALPDQPVDRATRIETGQEGSAELELAERARVQLDPSSVMVVAGLPRRQGAGTVSLLDGAVRAGVETGALLVRTPAAELSLQAGQAGPAGQAKAGPAGGTGAEARVEAEGRERALVAVYGGRAAVRAHGAEVQVPAGKGVRVEAGQQPSPPRNLLAAPGWEEGEGARRLVLGFGSLADEGVAHPQLRFAKVAGAEQYLVEVSRDPRFNDRFSGGEVLAPPMELALRPGRYHARVSALDKDRLMGPPSAAQALQVVGVRSDAAQMLRGRGAGATPILFHRAQEGRVVLSSGGLPLSVRVDGGAAQQVGRELALVLPAGEHRLLLRGEEAQAELRVRVAPPVLPEQPPGEPVLVADVPAPLGAVGLTGRPLQPRSRVYLLFGVGDARLRETDGAPNVYRLDLGGEWALWQGRVALEGSLPFLYQGGQGGAGVALGDLTLGMKGVLLSRFGDRLIVGPLLRLQLPTGTFQRLASDVGSEGAAWPVWLDPAVGAALRLGPIGLQSTQGVAALLSVKTPRVHWAMTYALTGTLGPIGLSTELDVALGMSSAAVHGVALGGGLRARLTRSGVWSALLGARGGLNEGGRQLLGRFVASAGVEWAPARAR